MVMSNLVPQTLVPVSVHVPGCSSACTLSSCATNREIWYQQSWLFVLFFFFAFWRCWWAVALNWTQSHGHFQGVEGQLCWRGDAADRDVCWPCMEVIDSLCLCSAFHPADVAQMWQLLRCAGISSQLLWDRCSGVIKRPRKVSWDGEDGLSAGDVFGWQCLHVQGCYPKVLGPSSAQSHKGEHFLLPSLEGFRSIHWKSVQSILKAC